MLSLPINNVYKSDPVGQPALLTRPFPESLEVSLPGRCIFSVEPKDLEESVPFGNSFMEVLFYVDKSRNPYRKSSHIL